MAGDLVKLASGVYAPKVAAEAYTAGSRSHSDLRLWQPPLTSPDAELLPERDTMVARSRDLDRNHGVADGARQTLHDNIVGSGLRLSAKPNGRVLDLSAEEAEAWSNQVEALWSSWWSSTSPDAAESLTGDGLTSQAFNSLFHGELLALPLWLPQRGRRWATCLQMLDPDRLSNPQGAPNGARLRGGVEKDGFGRAIAYHVRNTHPGEYFLGFSRADLEASIASWTRIPARTSWGRARVIHAYDAQRSSQSRGKPALTSVMRQFKVLGDYSNAELKAAVVNAMVAMFTESALDQEGIVELLSSNSDALKAYQEGLAQRNSASIEFTGGRIIPLRLGEKISSFAPQRPSTNFESFVTVLFRLIAAGLHMPYELLLKDFSKTNYSSARAALNEAWRFFRGRRKWVATYWLGPVYRLWLEEVVNAGEIEAPDFYGQIDEWCGARWIGDGRGYVDPLKEQQASRGRMEDNTSTLENECAEQGLDWEDVLEQRARELKRVKELEERFGIRFAVATPAASPMPAQDEPWDGEERRAPADAQA